MKLTKVIDTSRGLLFLILIVALGLLVPGIKWGIPSGERAKYYYEDPKVEAAINPHSVALHSYHPDEPKFLMAISNMDPANWDFNPRFFIYPSLQIYLIAMGLKVSSFLGWFTLSDSKEFYFANVDQVGRMYLVGRLITMMFGLATIYVTYRIGSRFYSSKSIGLLGALCLALIPAFAVNARYMSVDVPVTFWVMVTILVSSKLYHSRSYKWYAVAGFSTGLGTSTKYYGLLAVLCIITAHCMVVLEERNGKSLLLSLVDRRMLTSYSCALLGFFTTSPYTILAGEQFVREGVFVWLDNIFSGTGMSREMRLFTVDRGLGLEYLVNALPTGMGWPFYILSVCGVIFAVVKRNRYDWLMFSWFFCYLFIITLFSPGHVRYSIPLLPICSLFAARLVCQMLLEVKTGPAKWGVVVSGSLVLLFTSAYALSHVRIMMGRDNRDAAAEWIEKNVGRESVIGVGYPPGFYTAPLNLRKFRVEALAPPQTGFDEEKFNRLSPPYLMFSEFEYRQYLRLKDRFPAEARFFSRAINGDLKVGDSTYRVNWFDREPNVFGLEFDWEFPPHDWMYTHPGVIVLEKRPM